MSKPKSKNTKTYYVEPEDFHEEFNLCKKSGIPSTKLMIMFEKIARGMSRTFFSNNKIDTEAGISYAVTESWIKWEKYDINRSENIFAFFTTVITNDLKTYYNKLTKYKKRNVSIDAIFSNNNSNN